ncbi:MAG TPA: ABC transporter ATP-binding protein, partial [Gammaproteobacteria bacterium]|nr:ABC transporter ATP-binding protein [Gammaproteobacteria bacterium]
YMADPELLAQLVTDVPDEEQAPPEAETAQATPAELLLEPEQRKTVRNRLGVLFAIGALLMLMIAPGVRVYGTWITQRINQSLRSRMIERAEHLSLRYHSHARTGDAIYRVYQDSAMVTAIIDTIILRPVIALGQMLFSFLVICMFSLVLGAVYLAAIIPVIWLLKVYMPKLQTRSRSARETNSALTSRIQEVFGAIRVIKSNRAEEIIEQRFDEDSTAALNAAFAFRVEFILMATFTMMIAGAAIITAQYLMAGWTLAEQSTAFVGAVALVGFTVWNLGAFQSAATRGTDLTGNGRDMIHVWGMLQDMSVGLDRAFFLLELEPEIVDREDAISLPTPINHIRYENVSFGYLPNMPVLRDVTLRANVGTVTAIVGATGSGKSTLMSLLLRLYETDAGIISINDTHLSSIQLDSLRRGVAIALQQNTLFASSVADNIAYAFADASRADVEAAAKVACAHEFIQQMPQGYDTELGERGGDLSTGERQRLSIARAVIRDTPILVLDEPTASLDTE